MQFKLFLLLSGLVILARCVDKEKPPEITIDIPEPASISDDFIPPWPDQELLLHCTTEWEGEKRGLFTRYNPVKDSWHSKKVLSFFSDFDKDNILPDDRHWIILKTDRFDATSWPLLRSYTLNYKLGEIPISTETPIPFIFVWIHSSANKQDDVYLMESSCQECPSHYWWVDVKKCHEGDCQFQPLELGYPSSKNMWQGFWSPDFKYLFMNNYQEEEQASHLILTDHNESLLNDFGNGKTSPFWFDLTTFGFWSRTEVQDDSVLYYGSIDNSEIHPLFAKSDVLPLLPISPTLLTSKTYPTVNAKVGENQFIVSFRASYYDEPEPNNVYNLVINYNQSTDEFDVLWESFGRRGQYLSSDRTKIYVSTEYYHPWEWYSGDWEIIDLLSGEISTTNWLPLNPERYSDLSYNTEWRVNFQPAIQEPNHIIIGSSQPDSTQMIFTNNSGFEKTVDYPEVISGCSGGWVFK